MLCLYVYSCIGNFIYSYLKVGFLFYLNTVSILRRSLGRRQEIADWRAVNQRVRPGGAAESRRTETVWRCFLLSVLFVSTVFSPPFHAPLHVCFSFVLCLRTIIFTYIFFGSHLHSLPSQWPNTSLSWHLQSRPEPVFRAPAAAAHQSVETSPRAWRAILRERNFWERHKQPKGSLYFLLTKVIQQYLYFFFSVELGSFLDLTSRCEIYEGANSWRQSIFRVSCVVLHVVLFFMLAISVCQMIWVTRALLRYKEFLRSPLLCLFCAWDSAESRPRQDGMTETESELGKNKYVLFHFSKLRWKNNARWCKNHAGETMLL